MDPSRLASPRALGLAPEAFKLPGWSVVFDAYSPARLFTGDFTGDGKDDLAFTWNNGELYIGASDGAALSFNLAASIPGWSVVFDAASPARWFAGDFTGDGKTDLAFRWINNTVWVGRSTGGAITFDSDHAPRFR